MHCAVKICDTEDVACQYLNCSDQKFKYLCRWVLYFSDQKIKNLVFVSADIIQCIILLCPVKWPDDYVHACLMMLSHQGFMEGYLCKMSCHGEKKNNPNSLCSSGGKEEKDEWKKTEGGTEVMMSCPYFEPRTPCSTTMGPVDESHWG